MLSWIGSHKPNLHPTNIFAIQNEIPLIFVWKPHVRSVHFKKSKTHFYWNEPQSLSFQSNGNLTGAWNTEVSCKNRVIEIYMFTCPGYLYCDLMPDPTVSEGLDESSCDARNFWEQCIILCTHATSFEKRLATVFLLKVPLCMICLHTGLVHSFLLALDFWILQKSIRPDLSSLVDTKKWVHSWHERCIYLMYLSTTKACNRLFFLNAMAESQCHDMSLYRSRGIDDVLRESLFVSDTQCSAHKGSVVWDGPGWFLSSIELKQAYLSKCSILRNTSSFWHNHCCCPAISMKVKLEMAKEGKASRSGVHLKPVRYMSAHFHDFL